MFEAHCQERCTLKIRVNTRINKNSASFCRQCGKFRNRIRRRLEIKLKGNYLAVLPTLLDSVSTPCLILNHFHPNSLIYIQYILNKIRSWIWQRWLTLLLRFDLFMFTSDVRISTQMNEKRELRIMMSHVLQNYFLVSESLISFRIT